MLHRIKKPKELILLSGVKIAVFVDKKSNKYSWKRLNHQFQLSFFDFNHQNIKHLKNNDQQYEFLIIKIKNSSLCLKKYLTDLRARNKTIPIFVYFDNSNSQQRANYLKIGVNDCFSGNVCCEELMIKLNLFYEKKANENCCKNAFNWQRFHFCFKSKIATYKGKEIKLNKKEMLLLEQLLKRVNHTVPRNILYEKIWERDKEPKSNSLETYICSLRKKISKNCGFNLIQTVCGVGYRIKITKKPSLKARAFQIPN